MNININFYTAISFGLTARREGARAQGRGEISFSEFSNSRSGREAGPTSGANPLKENPQSHSGKKFMKIK